MKPRNPQGLLVSNSPLVNSPLHPPHLIPHHLGKYSTRKNEIIFQLHTAPRPAMELLPTAVDNAPGCQWSP